jgi:glucokinase
MAVPKPEADAAARTGAAQAVLAGPVCAEQRILAADIGGTKTLVALYQRHPDGSLHELRRVQYISRDYTGLLPILRVFLGQETAIAAATLGIAGPVDEGVCRATNLPWIVDASALARDLDIERVTLLNDFHATAIGVAGLGIVGEERTTPFVVRLTAEKPV